MQLESWEEIVKAIEGLVYVGDGFRWHWIRYDAPILLYKTSFTFDIQLSVDDVKMSSRTIDMLQMCPKEVSSNSKIQRYFSASQLASVCLVP